MKISNLFAVLLLGGMFFLMFFSSFDDSAIFDETAHIGAGYSYLTEKDGRLNPEHPPLIKDLSALPLMFLKLNFSTLQPFWNMKNVNDRQWLAGNTLLYKSGNDADKILLFSRLPIMILAIIFGFILFWWTQKNYGPKTGLLTLALFALSPTFLAHSRYVTTDLGAAFAFFLSIIFFIKFLEKNDNKSAIYFGIVLGFSLLVKFSLIILLPFFVVVKIGHHVFSKKEICWFSLKLIMVFLIALMVIYLFYIPHIWNYPLEQNLADARFTIGNYKTAKFAPEIVFSFLSNKITQPLGQYLHGFLMVAQRTAGGNSAYFLGEVSNKGWTSYFPVLFITKEQIGLYVLMILAIIISLKKFSENKFQKISVKTAIFLLFIAYYWAWSLWSPLNIGIRHILPTFPFIYILVSKTIVDWTKNGKFKKPIIFVLLFWMAAEIAFVYPYFLSYYNEFASGWRFGHKIATDSNYDWGQDLKRLRDWTTQNGVSKIYLDYFGGGSPEYYFEAPTAIGVVNFELWRYEKGPPPAGSYFAISANSLIGAENLYDWLKDKEPITRAGSSIFIYSF